MVDVTVAFSVDQQLWSHVFNVPTGTTIYHLKEQMLKSRGGKQDVDSFELRLRGRRVPDTEVLVQDQGFDFEFLGPDEGSRASAKEKQNKIAQDRADREQGEAVERRRREKDTEERRAQAEQERRAQAEAREQERKAQLAASLQQRMGGGGQAAAAPPAATGPPQDVQVVIRHAMNEKKQMALRVPSTFTILDLRKAIMEALGELRMSEVKLVKKQGTSFTSLTDTTPLGDKREFSAMGRKLEELPETSAPPAAPPPAHAAPPAPSLPPPKPAAPPLTGTRTVLVWLSRDFDFKMEVEVQGGMNIGQLKEQLAAADPTGQINVQDFFLGLPGGTAGGPARALRDSVVLTEAHLELDTTEQPPEEEPPDPYQEWRDQGYTQEQIDEWNRNNLQGGPAAAPAPPQEEEQLPFPWCLDSAKRMQWEFMQGFGAPEFQAEVDALHKEFPGEKKLPFRKKQTALFLTVQSKVLPRFGFEGSQAGLYTMMRAFTPEMNADPEIQYMTGEITRLLRQ